VRTVKLTVCNVTPCGFVDSYQRCAGVCYLSLYRIMRRGRQTCPLLQLFALPSSSVGQILMLLQAVLLLSW